MSWRVTMGLSGRSPSSEGIAPLNCRNIADYKSLRIVYYPLRLPPQHCYSSGRMIFFRFFLFLSKKNKFAHFSKNGESEKTT